MNVGGRPPGRPLANPRTRKSADRNGLTLCESQIPVEKGRNFDILQRQSPGVSGTLARISPWVKLSAEPSCRPPAGRLSPALPGRNSRVLFVRQSNVCWRFQARKKGLSRTHDLVMNLRQTRCPALEISQRRCHFSSEADHEKDGDVSRGRNRVFRSCEPGAEKEDVRPDREQTIQRDRLHLHSSWVRDLKLQRLCLRQHRIRQLYRFRRTREFGELLRAWCYAVPALARWPDRRSQLRCKAQLDGLESSHRVQGLSRANDQYNRR